MYALEELSKHFKFNFGIRFRETRSLLKGKSKFGPYQTNKKNELSMDVNAEVLETFLGNCVETFDPNSLVETIWGEDVVQGEQLKRGEMALRMLGVLQKGVGEDLFEAIFKAKRDDAGTDAMSLFNGFDTKIAEAITAGKVAVAKNNYVELDKIDATNALDLLKDFYRSASPKLKKQQTKLYVPVSILENYQDDYATTRGVNSYNTKFEQTILEGSQGKCEIVGLNNMEGVDNLILAPKFNMNINFNLRGGVQEQMLIDRFSSFELTYALAMFFGVGFHTFEPEFLKIGKLKTEGE